MAEIKSRKDQGKSYFQNMENVCDKSLSLNVKKRVLKYCIRRALQHDSESWCVIEQIRKNLENGI